MIEGKIEPGNLQTDKKINTIGIQWQKKEIPLEEKKRITVKEPEIRINNASTMPLPIGGTPSSSIVRVVVVVFEKKFPDGRVIPLPVGDFKVGSAKKCEINLDSSDSPPMQAVLSIKEEQVSLMDTSSKGTMLNGRNVLHQSADLLAINTIRVGDAKIVIFFIPEYIKKSLFT